MINQLILYVSDILRSMRFYRDIIGLSIKYPIYKTDEEYSQESWITLETGECVLALHSGGKSDFGEDAPRFNIEVNDLEGMRDLLLGSNIEVGEIFSPIPNKKILSVKDPEGINFYLTSHS